MADRDEPTTGDREDPGGSTAPAGAGEEELPEADVSPADPSPAGTPEDFQAEDPEQREIAGQAATERGDFLGLMGHLYRGAMSRATTWRTRLDRTANWSVVIVATLLTWAFSTQNNPHSIILLGMVVVSLFLFIEARRYRMYDVWRSRVRVLEENVFANALEPAGAEQGQWRRLLSDDLRRPAVKISLVEALARRLRRIYLALLLILLTAWLVRLAILTPTGDGLVATGHVWAVPGQVVVGLVGLYYVLLIGLAIWPMEREAKGKLRDREEAPDFSKDEDA